jgi:hypothetical protein
MQPYGEIGRATQSSSKTSFLRQVLAVVVGGGTSEYFLGSLSPSVLALPAWRSVPTRSL